MQQENYFSINRHGLVPLFAVIIQLGDPSRYIICTIVQLHNFNNCYKSNFVIGLSSCLEVDLW
jgi:hypothetical protein